MDPNVIYNAQNNRLYITLKRLDESNFKDIREICSPPLKEQDLPERNTKMIV